jgi:hypothetical protein
MSVIACFPASPGATTLCSALIDSVPKLDLVQWGESGTLCESSPGESLQALMQTVLQRAQLPVLCRLSWHPSCLRPSTAHGRHLREQVLQVLARFAPFWPLQNLRLSQVTPI